MNVDLRHLRAFVAVAEELHFGRAAARLGTAQPPLSVMIARIERELGVVLFERSSRRVSLTQAGADLLGEARGLLDVADETFRRINELRTGAAGSLRIGAAPSILSAIAAPVLARYRELAPQADVHVFDAHMDREPRMLADRMVDVGFFVFPDSSGTPSVEGLTFHRLVSERFVAVVGPTHPLADRKRVRLEEFESEQLVLWSRDWSPPLYDEVLRACRDRGFSPRIAHLGLLLMSRHSLIHAGYGYSFEPPSFWSSITGIRMLAVNPAAPTVTYYLAQRADEDSPLVKTFVELAMEHAAAGRITSVNGSGNGAR